MIDNNFDLFQKRFFPRKKLYPSLYILKTSYKNGYIFPGSENTLSYEVELLIDWTCKFNLQWYPFGTHR